jgi:hypothetical protein
LWICGLTREVASEVECEVACEVASEANGSGAIRNEAKERE